MNLANVVLLALAAAFTIIGIYDVVTRGFGSGYWALMVAVIFFFIFSYRKRR